MADEAERVLAAARDGDIQTLQSLKRTVPFASDSFGATALHHATRYGKLDCLKWMVEKAGMKAKVKAKNGATPLHDACTQGKLLCVKFFIQDCNLSPDVTDNSGHTPLHLAARFGYLDIVKWLMEKAKCNHKVKTLNRMSPVHFAATGGHLKCLEFLVSKGNPVVINERATDGTTPIYLAAQNGHFSCLKYLHTVGARSETRSRDGMHLIHTAAQNGHLDCVGYLVVQGLAKENEPDVTGATPAHYAAGEGHVPVLKWLNKRSNLNVKDSLGGTPLHDASEKGQYEAIQFLVEVVHLDTKLKDNSGMSPIELTDKYGHKQCYDYLKDAATKILKIKAEKMSSQSQLFDKQTVEENSGSSFLHVLKRKPKQAERPPSPKNAVGPDLPPLECSPDVSPRTSPVPPLLLYGKTNEWNSDVVLSDASKKKQSKVKPEVVRKYENEGDHIRTHVMDYSETSRYSPLPPGMLVNKENGETKFLSSNIDAYSHNKENALEFDAIPQEQLTEEMLNKAKMRTRFLSSKLQNGFISSTPVHDFDHRPAEIAARHVQEFNSKIQAARARKSPTTTRREEQQHTPNENMKNENETMEMNESEPSLDNISEPADRERITFDDESVTATNPATDQHILNHSPSPGKTSSVQKVNSFKSVSPKPRDVPSKTSSLSPKQRDIPSEFSELPYNPQRRPVKEDQIHKETNNSDEASPDQSLSTNRESQRTSPHSSETEAESIIDEENYETTTDDEKSRSLPREKSEHKDDFLPLRKRQLMPLPHIGGPSAPFDEQDQPMDEDTWRNLPEWKRQVFKDRIMKKQSAELEKRKKEEEESRKWEGVPAWKIPIMQRKESDRRKNEEKTSSMPEWRRELLQKKRNKQN